MKKLNRYIHQIRILISKSEIEQAITEMQKLIKGSPAFDDIIIQSSRYNSIVKSIRMGTIGREASNVELQRVNAALLDMLTELEENYNSNVTLQSEIKAFWNKSQANGGSTIIVIGKNNKIANDVKTEGDVNIQF